ncbi:MAG: Mov34/MPN/PAD-1 family protein [Chloroflexi bacterium]|nr:Mov34/MPN/PAD-1 family protein [Chloroflexota bacterium]
MMRLILAAQMLEEARRFFEDRGTEGLEGTALIARRADGVADRLVIPQQVADRVGGCWVEVPLAGKLQLAAALGIDEQYVARIHSHPGDAFHSPADDRNPALTFEGALSIVAPYFGLGLRRGLDACAVYRRQGGSWVELPAGPGRDSWVSVL